MYDRTNFEFPEQERVGKFKIHNIVSNFPSLDFLVRKIKEREIQNSFGRSMHYFSIHPTLPVNNQKNPFLQVVKPLPVCFI